MFKAASMTDFDHFANELTERELLLDAERVELGDPEKELAA